MPTKNSAKLYTKRLSMHFGRFEISEKTVKSPLPHEWTEELIRTLTEAYYVQSEKDNRFFHVHGEIYEKEFVVVVSYIHHDDQMTSPISLFISHDIAKDSKKFKVLLKNLVDLTGEIFDDVFSVEDWSDYTTTWNSNKYKGFEFFYKITRENVSLSIQAEEFLKKNGNV
jgi:hypothetical protein